jgi:selenide,water dikinase
LDNLPTLDRDERVLVGTETNDDAGVFRLTKDMAIVQTVDLFPPVINDPFMYGKIVAANSISDVYAMGAIPITVLNIVMFPSRQVHESVMAEILAGAIVNIRASGAALMGGHTQVQAEINYGLSVTGIVHPDRVVKNCTAKPGDLLYLTKPLGVGIITTAIRADLVPADLQRRVSESMADLNRGACFAMVESGANAATDITGFGLMGHAFEMAAGSKVTIEVSASKVPYFKEARTLYENGIYPGGSVKNMKHLLPKTKVAAEIDETTQAILFDCQTSGGLLISIPEKRAAALEKAFKKFKVNGVLIGRVLKKSARHLAISK